MKILELFSGYGTASFALKRLQMDYELVGYSDIDKYANHCFKQNHCPDDTDDKLRLTDVTKVDEKTLPDFDLLTGGFPCQAFSVAGKMQGELDARGTLFYEIIRIAEHKQPKYMLLENVKGLTSKKFKDTFDKILSELDRIGYDVHWKVLNSKEHGIPQSRARVWFVCFRKDLGRTSFQFPEPVELEIFIKDILEPVVDSKYYLSEKLQERFAKYLEEKESKNKVYDNHRKDEIREYENVSYTLSQAMGTGGNNVPMVVANCLDANMHKGIDPVGFYDKSKRNIVKTGQLRRLTPTECFRLMSFLNDEIQLEGLSDTQKYKLAGNGQDVNVVTLLFERMFNTSA